MSLFNAFCNPFWSLELHFNFELNFHCQSYCELYFPNLNYKFAVHCSKIFGYLLFYPNRKLFGGRPLSMRAIFSYAKLTIFFELTKFIDNYFRKILQKIYFVNPTNFIHFLVCIFRSWRMYIREAQFSAVGGL